MSQTAAALKSDERPHDYPIGTLLADIAGIDFSTDLTDRKRRSRDYFWYSPILNEQLKDKLADVVVSPKSEDDVIRVAAACAKHRIPLTPRGGATGNYGQCVPLDRRRRARHVADEPDRMAEARPAARRGRRQAVRHRRRDPRRTAGNCACIPRPSAPRRSAASWRAAAAAPAASPMAACASPATSWRRAIVTLEETPRVIELRGDASQKISRAYGTTGIITALEMPLAPALPWIDVIVAFDDLVQAVRFGHAIALADGIVKKLLSPIQWPLPSHFAAYRDYCPEGKSLLLGMIGEMSIESFETLLGAVRRHRHLHSSRPRISLTKVPLYEHTWNHTTLQMLKTDRGVTYLQCLYPHDRLADAVAQVGKMFEGEVMQHLEFIRINGLMTASGIPVVRYRSPERLYEIIAGYEVVRHHDRQPACASRSRTAAATSASMPTNSASSTRSTRWACSTRARCEASCPRRDEQDKRCRRRSSSRP